MTLCFCHKVTVTSRRCQYAVARRLTPEAYDALMEITNESCLSVKMVLSEIIMQCKDIIVFDRPKESEKEE